MDMVEKVARAICAEENYGDPDDTYETPLGQRISWRGFLPEARAAIEAMREPDQQMIAAMNNAAASYPGDNLELRMWRSGIDQALGDRDKEASAL